MKTKLYVIIAAVAITLFAFGISYAECVGNDCSDTIEINIDVNSGAFASGGGSGEETVINSAPFVSSGSSLLDPLQPYVIKGDYVIYTVYPYFDQDMVYSFKQAMEWIKADNYFQYAHLPKSGDGNGKIEVLAGFPKNRPPFFVYRLDDMPNALFEETLVRAVSMINILKPSKILIARRLVVNSTGESSSQGTGVSLSGVSKYFGITGTANTQNGVTDSVSYKLGNVKIYLYKSDAIGPMVKDGTLKRGKAKSKPKPKNSSLVLFGEDEIELDLSSAGNIAAHNANLAKVKKWLANKGTIAFIGGWDPGSETLDIGEQRAYLYMREIGNYFITKKIASASQLSGKLAHGSIPKTIMKKANGIRRYVRLKFQPS